MLLISALGTQEASKRPARGQEEAPNGGTPRNTETIEKQEFCMKRIHQFCEPFEKPIFQRNFRGMLEASKKPARGQQEASKRPARSQRRASKRPARGQQEASPQKPNICSLVF